MRPKLNARKAVISSYIQEYYLENDRLPSERDIVSGTGIPLTSVHRYLVEMRDSGELSYEGRRSVRTEALEHVSPKSILPVLGYVACGPGEEEEERFIEYIHMPERLIGCGDFFALIAKGESMVDVGVHPGDHVIVRRQQTADDGDLIIALLNGKNNLKKLVQEDGKYLLRSCNAKNHDAYPDIEVGPREELRIQGIAVGAYHSFQRTECKRIQTKSEKEH